MFRYPTNSTKCWLCILLLNLVDIKPLQAGNAHNHGQAYMNIVLDGQELIVNTTLSASDIIGFEYHPESESEHQNIDVALKKLTSAEEWMAIKSGGCVKQSVHVVNPYVEKSTISEHTHHDFEVTVKYKCQKPDEISALQIKLTQNFSQIQGIEIQWLVHNKQGLENLHGNKQEVRFK